MLVGIDARNLVPGMSGLGRFVAGAVGELHRQGANVHLFLPQAAHVDMKDRLADVAATVSACHGPILRTYWGHTLLPRQAASRGVDVLWGPAHRLPGRVGGKMARVVTIHDLVWRHAPETMRRQTWLGDRVLMRRAVEAADMVVADSDATRQSLMEEFRLHERPPVRIYPGVTALRADAQIDIRSRFGIERPYALFVGTPEPRKNLPRLIEAYCMLAPALRQRCMLVLAGGAGWGTADLARSIQGFESDIRLAGRVSDGELAALYQGCLFAAFPSLYEGFGFPIVEANTSGKPVLASHGSSMPEVGGAAALLVDPGSTASIGEGLARMIADDGLREGLAARAEANAARFTWQHFGEQMLSVFERAVAARRAAG
jgi:glycosyltransferase involved in cell wall biosynthesis